ncbi:MAG: MIP/aquaporin family protein [Erythrobacter sp.]|uniref:aquaporin n=1 Tax=Erythrobacter sp. TaxID=1042 RepID=UPI002639A16E|nr:MIP/aquaporin family protein [Erythrobacter sp.]MDJ0979488.1 MIP/aquaporin family protein [Erythrobacter sp.]
MDRPTPENALSREAAPNAARKLTAEAIGTFFLFLGVISSGIMAESLATGNAGVALLSNTLAVGAILFVVIVMLAPISGAHFNPAVTLAFVLRREIGIGLAFAYVATQLVAGSTAALAAHVMFEQPLIQIARTARTGIGQWTGEFIATFGLVLTVLLLVRYRPTAIPAAVALYISSAIWFTSSTSFANPAITVARALSDTYTGIAPADAPMFIGAQLTGAVVAALLAQWLVTDG